MSANTNHKKMTAKKKADKLDATTEEKIKEAARVVFHKKGFAATRTRDIAEEAGINLALLNYYFRSKQKLFEIIMTETLVGFVQSLTSVINDGRTSLEEKITQVASNYIDLLSHEPEIPVFILSEIRNNPGALLEKLPIRETINRSVMFQQHKEAVEKGRITEPNPLHFLMNVIGLIVFPFIAKPLLQGIGKLKNTEFNELMQERKTMIPVWVKAMIKAK